eukprot:CAMPEP_0204838894 /NCGR_PEP_ID=MMETSP1346-20131115/32379_1 /ASSEMBLY_ACC=CAM_ASM_000771 /TAXON_ID=215587 /ORGANISM="Aplanochytrium stocchinoi, Strain GSBS06" /LENGTH=304 /DNA_ID=CAMNT_0051975239 /DNA_START=374 /DNA_END=1288 /DNA_ORIENTATION=-
MSSVMDVSCDFRSSHFANSTPLSAQLVNNWSFLSSSASGGNTSSPIDLKQIKELEQYVKQVAYSTPATIASTVTATTDTRDEESRVGEGSFDEDIGDKENRDVLRGFLSSLNLIQYAGSFESEDLLDLNMIAQMCCKDRSEFKKTLSEIGVSKIGHREKIILALLEYSSKEKKKKKLKKKSKKLKKKKKDKLIFSSEKKYLKPSVEQVEDTIIFNAALESSRRNKEKAAKLIAQHAQANIRRLASTLTREVVGNANNCQNLTRRYSSSHYWNPDIQSQHISFYPKGENARFVRSKYYRKIGIES